MNTFNSPPVVINDGRFVRTEAIEWWDQPLIKNARVLVVGAGALGNEVIKNLALLGVGHVVIIDMDFIELSNLNRSVLFRESDKGQSKVQCAARAARDIYPQMQVHPIHGNVLSDVGLGYFNWAQVVVGALDNREARVFVNRVCAQLAKPWIDGGIEVLRGMVRGFAPPKTACYECTMSQIDWDDLNRRRSCSLLAKRAMAQNGTPTTSTTASIIGAIQAQEVIKILHGMDALLGKGFFYDGQGHNSYSIVYPVNPDCQWHESTSPVESLTDMTSGDSIQKLWHKAAQRLQGLDAIDFSRELVETMECPSCGQSQNVFQPAEIVPQDKLVCNHCMSECSPKFFHSISTQNEFADKRICDLGLPEWDIVWARFKDKCVGLEIAGDASIIGLIQDGKADRLDKTRKINP